MFLILVSAILALLTLLCWAFLYRRSPRSIVLLVTDKNKTYFRGHTARPARQLAKESGFIAAKLNSPLVSCRRCGSHPSHVVCFPLDVMDRTSFEIMLKLLSDSSSQAGLSLPRHPVAHVLDVAEYLLLAEDRLQEWLPLYFLDDHLGARSDPRFLPSIRDMYVAGYCHLARTLFMLWDSREQRVLSLACRLYPDAFKDTDFFWGN